MKARWKRDSQSGEHRLIHESGDVLGRVWKVSGASSSRPRWMGVAKNSGPTHIYRTCGEAKAGIAVVMSRIGRKWVESMGEGKVLGVAVPRRRIWTLRDADDDILGFVREIVETSVLDRSEVVRHVFEGSTEERFHAGFKVLFDAQRKVEEWADDLVAGRPPPKPAVRTIHD